MSRPAGPNTGWVLLRSDRGTGVTGVEFQISEFKFHSKMAFCHTPADEQAGWAL